MPNANARKGQRWESAVRDYLNSAGMNNATRVAQAGTDVGDIHLNGLFALQHLTIYLVCFIVKKKKRDGFRFKKHKNMSGYFINQITDACYIDKLL